MIDDLKGDDYMYKYKEWMLKFYWLKTKTDEIFYFNTKEDMLEFSKHPDVLVEAMFHVEKITE